MNEKVKKLKFADLIKDETLNQLDIDQLADIQGGFALMDACYRNICTTNRDGGVGYCDGSAICTDGMGPICTSSPRP